MKLTKGVKVIWSSRSRHHK